MNREMKKALDRVAVRKYREFLARIYRLGKAAGNHSSETELDKIVPLVQIHNDTEPGDMLPRLIQGLADNGRSL